MNIVKFNKKINTIKINIANNSVDQRSRSYDNSELSQVRNKVQNTSQVYFALTFGSNSSNDSKVTVLFNIKNGSRRQLDFCENVMFVSTS